MKQKTYFIIAVTLLFSLLLFTQQACKKEAENQPPTCDITSPDNGQEITKGETVTIAVDANDSDGSIAEVRFFIDNVGVGSATTFPYNYEWNTGSEDTGNHTLKATAIDNNSKSTSDEISVTIIAGGSTPVANFTATPTSGIAPLTVNFIDQSTDEPTSWQWDFGDGNTSTLQNPSHTYNDVGSYTVTLTVSNDYGSDSETKTNHIVVSNSGTFTDPRDGQTYNIVIIGTQTWFAENLNYETTNSWWYDNSSANGDIYGRLYTWEAALTACPSGWHLPSDDEWKTLEMYLGMSQAEADQEGWRGTDEGGKLKESGTAHWKSPNTGATNSSDFTALPGGIRNFDGSFSHLGPDGNWWSSTEYSSTMAWIRGMSYIDSQVYRGYYDKPNGFSVRCLKD